MPQPAIATSGVSASGAWNPAGAGTMPLFAQTAQFRTERCMLYRQPLKTLLWRSAVRRRENSPSPPQAAQAMLAMARLRCSARVSSLALLCGSGRRMEVRRSVMLVFGVSSLSLAQPGLSRRPWRLGRAERIDCHCLRGFNCAGSRSEGERSLQLGLRHLPSSGAPLLKILAMNRLGDEPPAASIPGKRRRISNAGNTADPRAPDPRPGDDGEAPAVNELGPDAHFYNCTTCGSGERKLVLCEGWVDGENGVGAVGDDGILSTAVCRCPRVYHRLHCNAGPCPAGFTYYCPVCQCLGVGWQCESLWWATC